MDISKVVLDDDHSALLAEVSGVMISLQGDLDLLQEEYQAAIDQLNSVKAKIRPIKEKLSPLAEYQASIASRKSRAKYFPEFATKNYRSDTQKDNAFLDMVREALE
jgi:phage shock protein A